MVGNRDLILDRTKLGAYTFQFNHCGFQACTAGYTYGFALRPYHLIHFVLDGSGTLKTEQNTYSIHARQAFYLPAGSGGTYQASFEDPWKYFWVGFYADSRNCVSRQLFGSKQVIDLTMPVSELEPLFLSLVSVTDPRLCHAHSYTEAEYPGEQFCQITDFSKSLEVNSRMLHLFSRLLETQAVCLDPSDFGPNPARDAKAYMDASYCEPLKMQDVAAALHVHPNYLSTIFKKTYGQSPSGYLRSIRMEHSAMLLALTDYPVSAVAQAVGYPNAFQFSAVFKQYFQVSPSAYRKQEKQRQAKH